MSIAKIIIQGGTKSFKTTLAQLIEDALHQENIRVENNDSDAGEGFLSKRINALEKAALKTPVIIEVVSAVRAPTKGSAYDAAAE